MLNCIVTFLFLFGSLGEAPSFTSRDVQLNQLSKTSFELGKVFKSSSENLSHQHHESAEESDCTEQQCHLCHSSHCFMELCVVANLTIKNAKVINSRYKFSYSYSFARVFKRPPINS